jgi:CRISPR-associated protein Cas2
MFVAVNCDLGSEDSRIKVSDLLRQYGFRKVQTGVFESATINEKNLARMKLELDKVTDSYDLLRFYQYPVDETLIITSLESKRWKRLVVRL